MGEQSCNPGTSYSNFWIEKMAPSYLLRAAGVHVFFLLVHFCHQFSTMCSSPRRFLENCVFWKMLTSWACGCSIWCVWSSNGFDHLCFAISNHCQNESREKKENRLDCLIFSRGFVSAVGPYLELKTNCLHLKQCGHCERGIPGLSNQSVSRERFALECI